MIVVKNFKSKPDRQEKLLKILCQLLTAGSYNLPEKPSLNKGQAKTPPFAK